MTAMGPLTADRRERAFAALAYEAPFLIEKLIFEQIVTTEAEALALFREAKRYLVLAFVDPDPSRAVEMYSRRVDEVWHQFVLFTKAYISFSLDFFGAYVPHSPSNAPEVASDPVVPYSFDEFASLYEATFAEPLPDIWFDERAVSVDRRVLNDLVGSLVVRDVDGDTELATVDDDLSLRVDSMARPALAFIAKTRAFYTRELPGDLADDEKVGIVASLVESKVLRVAP